MTRLPKILVCIAALLVAVTAVVSFAVSADAGELTIADTGVVFDNGSLKLTCDVDKSSIASGETIRIYFWDTDPSSVGMPSLIQATAQDKTADGKNYLTFESAPLRHQDMRRPIYAMAVTTDESGSILRQSATVKYSVFDYALELIDAGLDDQVALFTKLLDYGTAMQRALLAGGVYTAAELQAAGGYANEYCKVDTEFYIDGEYKETATSYYAPDTWFEMKADKSYGNAVFCGFFDEDGNALLEYGELTSPTWNEYGSLKAVPGTTVYKKHYSTKMGTADGFDTYSSITKCNVSITNWNTRFQDPLKTTLTTDKKGVASTTIVPKSAYTTLVTRGTEQYMAFNKVIKAEDATKYPEGYTGSTSGAYKAGDVVTSTTVENTGLYLLNENTAENVAYHVFEADIMLYSSHSNATVTQIVLQNADGEALWAINLNTKSSSKLGLSVLYGEDEGKAIGEDVSLPQSDWFNLRIEYYPLAGDEMEVKVYLDGQHVGQSFTAPASPDVIKDGGDDTLGRITLYHLNSIKNVTFALDNVILTSIEKE